MALRCLITGGTGSGGSYLADYILENHPEYEVWMTSRWHSTSVLKNIEHIKDRIIVKECDLTDLSSVIRLLVECNPERIFNLASTANVRISFDTPIAVFNNNSISTMNLFEAVKMICPMAIIQHCSTSEVLGNPTEFPMTENHPIRPVNPYSASKVAQEALAYSYAQSWGLRIVISRAFAYINPRRRDLFASSFAYQIAEIEADKRQFLSHGNLNSVRTLVDVRDMAHAYWLLCEKGEYASPYNIGGKDIISVKELLQELIKHAQCPIKTELDKNLLRPKDVTKQIPDISKFIKATGWEPKYTLYESLEWLLNHARKEVSNAN